VAFAIRGVVFCWADEIKTEAKRKIKMSEVFTYDRLNVFR